MASCFGCNALVWLNGIVPKVELLVSEAARERDDQKRLDEYTEAQRVVWDDAPWIFVNSTLQIRAIRKEVKGYELNPTQMFFGMENVSLQ